MPPNRPRLYWDTSVFLAWMMDEPRAPGELEGIEKVARQVHDGEVILITSVMTNIEILQSQMTHQAQELFKRVFDRPNVAMIDIDFRVSEVAKAIRDYYVNLRGRPFRKIKSPDAVHLATAVLYKATTLFTFDSDMLNLGSDVAGRPIVIRRPWSAQMAFQGQGF